MANPPPLVAYNPNVDEDGNLAKGDVAKFPVFDTVYTPDDYASVFMKVAPTVFESWASRTAIGKASALPPDMQSFATFSLMPEVHNGGVIQVPGIPFEALRKIARENLAPQMIIGMRVDDVQRYSELSSHPWKPGWRIELRAGLDSPTAKDLQDIKDAERFLLNCNIDTEWNARKRDARRLDGFGQFLSKIVRDSLTYDGMAIWTDCDLNGRVKAFAALSAFNIRLCGPQGFQGNPEQFAVAVDDAGNILQVFTREELTWYVRNPRADPDVFGYGYSEIEMGVKLVQGFTNAMDMNCDTFTRNAIPPGFLIAEGAFTQRQLDVLSRIWSNLKKGTTKAWAIPVISLPKDADLRVVPLMELKGKEGYYDSFMNMLIGAFCTIYRFPVNRIGYKASGMSRDSYPRDAQADATLVDENDNGLMPLLHHLEVVINEYILWSRWPHLKFSFCAKNPKEDLREYEARMAAATLEEHRKLADLPPLETLAKGAEEKKLARIMALCPKDSALSAVYQAIVATAMKIEAEAKTLEAEEPNAEFGEKTDPVKSAQHGHASGVKRDSAAERKQAKT